jgi:hypothetical protein
MDITYCARGAAAKNNNNTTTATWWYGNLQQTHAQNGGRIRNRRRRRGHNKQHMQVWQAVTQQSTDVPWEGTPTSQWQCGRRSTSRWGWAGTRTQPRQTAAQRHGSSTHTHARGGRLARTAAQLEQRVGAAPTRKAQAIAQPRPRGTPGRGGGGGGGGTDCSTVPIQQPQRDKPPHREAVGGLQEGDGEVRVLVRAAAHPHRIASPPHRIS